MSPRTTTDLAVTEEGGRAGGTPELVFQMPLHYPKYSKFDYETMPEWKLDHLLAEYGLPVSGDVEAKRSFAIGAFIWPADCPKELKRTSIFEQLSACIMSFIDCCNGLFQEIVAVDV